MDFLYCYLRLGVLVALLVFNVQVNNDVYAAQYVDAVGRSVELSAPPRRIVSLVPSVTEIIYALHAEDQLVGVTDFCNYPPAATTKQSIGSYADPGLETVASLSPDLIIMGVASSDQVLLDQFEQLGVPVYLVSATSLHGTMDTIIRLGELTGHQSQAQLLVAAMSKQIEKVKRMRHSHAVRTLVCVMIKPLIVAAGATLADDLITMAGGSNVAAALQRYPTISMEAVLAYDPELIIVSPHPGTPNPADFFLNWPQLQAVRNKHVINVPADLLQRPGPRLVDGLLALAHQYEQIANGATLHGGADK